MKKRILTVGSASMTMNLSVKRIPSVGETLIDNGGYSFAPGGNGTNSAVAFARLGADSVYCAKVGNDANGDKLIAFCEENGIDTRFISRSDRSQTGLALVTTESSGMNRTVIYQGTNNFLGKDDVDEAFLCYPDALYLNFEIPFDAVITACEYAERQEVPIFIDCAFVNSNMLLEKLPRLEILSPNETETYKLTGIMPDNMDNCLKAAVTLYERLSVKYIVIKLGSRGCFVYDGRYRHFCTPYEVEAIDTTAAGDAFTAALTLEYMRTLDVLASCRYANAVGALTVSKPGAAESLPIDKNVEKFMKEHGNND